MNIFINGVSKDGIIISFDHTRNIIDRQPIDIRMKESKEFPLLIDTFIKEKVGGYETLKNIILVHGPGSFTGIRALVLTINTLKFIYPHLQLTALSYFQLFTGYPIVKTSSKKDVFIQFSQNENIQVLSNEDFFSMCGEKKIQTVFGEEVIGSSLKFENTMDYDTIVKECTFSPQSLITPLYIKKPNIS